MLLSEAPVPQRRRRWSRDPTEDLFLPTESLGFVRLSPDGQLSPSPHHHHHEAREQQPQPLRPLPKGAAQLPSRQPQPQLDGVFTTRPVSIEQQRRPRRKLPPPAAPEQARPSQLALSVAQKARIVSVQRLRNAVAMERRQMHEALQQSAVEAAAYAEGGLQVSAALWESAQLAAQESSQDAVLTHVLMASASDAVPPHPRGKSQRDYKSQRRGPVEVQAAPLEQPEEEYNRQLQRAICESVREDERRRADAQHEEASTLKGLIESLRDAPALPTVEAKEAGRRLAQQILEAHLAEGGGLG